MHPHLAGLGFTIEQCSSVDGAVEEGDIVTTVTATVRDHPVGQPCQPDIHMNAVVGMPGEMELSKDILLRSDIFLEYPPQTRIEGQIQQLPVQHPLLNFDDWSSGRPWKRRPDHGVRQRRLRHRRRDARRDGGSSV
ncbi:hypothetical protein V7798_01285 [Rhizobium laguerreae]|nr:hypothetical protein [Rhizobium leguminosarum]